jgi:hypothetical protein
LAVPATATGAGFGLSTAPTGELVVTASVATTAAAATRRLVGNFMRTLSEGIGEKTYV